MSIRKKTSGGQAIVMVTLALMAMCGMMGLAVDLGWSFFVKKEAQAAADGAALAAVQEALRRNGGAAGVINCGLVDCVEPITPCTSFTTAASNLSSGCAYAISNGFKAGGLGGRQNVTIQANTTAPPPTAPGVKDIKYWVTVRTWQSIPQLFSSVLGNTDGAVSAIATAAIAGSIVPGSFYGMNHEGDCLTGLAGAATPAGFNCGVDVDLTSSNGKTACTNMDGSSSGVVAKLCAPAGAFLSSQCNGSFSAALCKDPGSAKQNFAGQTSNLPLVWAEGGTQIRGAGWVSRNGNFDASATNWVPHPPGVIGESGADFSDPTHTIPQPKLVSAAQPLCAVTGGVLTTGTLGPYQYYAANSSGQATGLPLTIGNNTQVTFDPNSTGHTVCQGTPGTPSTGSFQTFTFWGGLSMGGNANTKVNFGTATAGGQFVMAGTNSPTGTVLFADMNGTITGNSTLGTQFLLTNGNYSSQGTALTTPPALTSAGITLYQGFTEFKNAKGTLTGVTSAGTAAAPALSGDENFLFWQDRNNSNDTLNPNDGSFISFTHPSASPNRRTDTSPQFVLDDGGLGLNMQGVFYQPRGAWTYLKPGGAAAAGAVTLMMVTGALTCGGAGCGSATVTLLGPSAPITVFITALVQ